MFAPRGRSQQRLLLDVADLDTLIPSTLWDRVDEGTWRTGVAGSAQPAWQAAAHEAGSVTAWRSFTSEEGDVVTLQVVPLGSDVDAPDALAAATDPAAPFRTPPPPPGAPAGDPLVHAATVGRHLVVAVAVGPGWTRHDLAELVTAQLTKLPS